MISTTAPNCAINRQRMNLFESFAASAVPLRKELMPISKMNTTPRQAINAMINSGSSTVLSLQLFEPVTLARGDQKARAAR